MDGDQTHNARRGVPHRSSRAWCSSSRTQAGAASILRCFAGNIDLVGHFFADYPDLFECEAPIGRCVSSPRYLGADSPEVFAGESSKRPAL